MTQSAKISSFGKFESIGHFLEVAGRKEFQEDTGFKCQQVTNAKRRGVFPSDWYWPIRNFCLSRELCVPEQLFKGYVAPVRDGASAREETA